MGFPGAWYYGKTDLGSAIETAEASIAKIKTNKFDNDDLVEVKKSLTEVVAEIDKALANEA